MQLNKASFYNLFSASSSHNKFIISTGLYWFVLVIKRIKKPKPCITL